MAKRKKVPHPTSLRVGQPITCRIPCACRAWIGEHLYDVPEEGDMKGWLHIRITYLCLPYVRGVVVKPKNWTDGEIIIE